MSHFSCTIVALLLLCSSVCSASPLRVIRDGEETKLSHTVTDMLAAPGPGLKSSAVWYGRMGANLQRDGEGRLYCMGNSLGPNLVRSNDEGRTWRATELSLPGFSLFIAFAVLPDDTLLALYEPVGSSHRAVWCARSSDGGDTWRARRLRLDLGAHRFVGGKDANIVVRGDGALVVPLRLWDSESAKGSDEALAHAFVSDDAGRTWQRRGVIAEGVRHVRMTQTKTGSLLACSYDANVKRVVLSESTDAAKTWTPPRTMELSESGPADLTRLADGTLILSWLFQYNPEFEVRTRGVRAVVSRDGGKTWADDLYIVAQWGPGGYGGYLPGHLAMDGGDLLTARVTKSGSGLRMQAVRWNPIKD